MTPDTPPVPTPHTIDLTGLPEQVVREVEHLVAVARAAQAGVPPPKRPILPNPAQLDREAWSARLRAFAASRPRREGVNMDDSRESIYEWDGQ